MNLKSLLANRTFLYVVLAFSVASLFGYVVAQNTNAVLLFILTGYIATHFSKNMTVILLVPLVLTNFVFNANRIKEGLKNKDDKAEEENNTQEEEDDEEEEDPKTKKTNKGKKSSSNNTTTSVNVNGGDGDNVQPNVTESNKKKNVMNFSNLEDILNGGGLDRMTQGMSGMVQNHEKLQNMIETMSPLIDKAGALLERVNTTDMGNIGGMVDKMTNMLGGLQGTGSNPAPA